MEKKNRKKKQTPLRPYPCRRCDKNARKTYTAVSSMKCGVEPGLQTGAGGGAKVVSERGQRWRKKTEKKKTDSAPPLPVS